MMTKALPKPIRTTEEKLDALALEYVQLKTEFDKLANLMYPLLELAETRPDMPPELFRRHIIGIAAQARQVLIGHERTLTYIPQEVHDYISGMAQAWEMYQKLREKKSN